MVRVDGAEAEEEVSKDVIVAFMCMVTTTTTTTIIILCVCVPADDVCVDICVISVIIQYVCSE